MTVKLKYYISIIRIEKRFTKEQKKLQFGRDRHFSETTSDIFRSESETYSFSVQKILSEFKITRIWDDLNLLTKSGTCQDRFPFVYHNLPLMTS